MIVILILFLAISNLAKSQELVISNIRYNIGTNGFDLFCGVINGEDTNEIYMWQETVDLNSTNWMPTTPPWQGHAASDVFWTPVVHGDTNRFFRIIKIGNLYQNDSVSRFSDISNRCFPSTNLPPSP